MGTIWAGYQASNLSALNPIARNFSQRLRSQSRASIVQDLRFSDIRFSVVNLSNMGPNRRSRMRNKAYLRPLLAWAVHRSARS